MEVEWQVRVSLQAMNWTIKNETKEITISMGGGEGMEVSNCYEFCN